MALIGIAEVEGLCTGKGTLSFTTHLLLVWILGYDGSIALLVGKAEPSLVSVRGSQPAYRQRGLSG